MSNLKKISYVFIALAIALLLAAISITVAFNVNEAYADYIDIASDPTAIVNFNQIYKTEESSITAAGITRITTEYTYSISGTATSNDYIWTRVPNTNSSHYYYFNCFNSDISIRVQNFSNDTSSPFIWHGATQFQYAINFVSGQTYNITIQPILVDLTLMFGSNDNIPTLDECNSIFVTYYPYNTGSPVSYSTFDSYALGYNQAYGDLDVAFDSNVNYSNVFLVSGNIAYDSSAMVVMPSTIIGFNFNMVFSRGDVLTIDLHNFYGTSTNSGVTLPYIDFGVFENGEFIAINSINTALMQNNPNTLNWQSAVQNGSVSFTIPYDLASIYIRFGTGDSTSALYAIDYFNFNVRVHNVSLAVQNAYKNGQQETINYYNSFYGVGGSGYNQIYESGYNAGLVVNNTYTFGYLMSSVIEAPLNAVLNIFNFDFLGYNFKNFITVMITLCFIIAIVRMFMGGKE